MKLAHRTFGWLLMVMMLTAAGCKGGENAAENASIPSDLRIIVGQQGTFAGRGMGYTIDAAGNVSRWEGKYPGEIVQADTTIEPGQVEQLWRRAEEIGFLSMQDQEMASIYNFVSVRARGESRRVTWTQRDDDAPTPAQAFYDECMQTARAAFGEMR